VLSETLSVNWYIIAKKEPTVNKIYLAKGFYEAKF
jgi:hypothetical protein